MAFLQLHPHYRAVLAHEELHTAKDFLRLGGVIYCGHPDRNVARLELGPSQHRIAVFLKREHRIPWRDRWANAFAGFGFVSKSRRESMLLQQLAAAGIDSPEVVAVGEDGGRAFLLLREIPQTTDLRRSLAECRAARQRCQLAAALGRHLARIHTAGFDHPDLFAKHILVSSFGSEEPCFYLLDWQRSRQTKMSWARRCRDLAMLDATIADRLASPRERLRCLVAYLHASLEAPPLRRVAGVVRRRVEQLLRKKRIRNLRLAPLEYEKQNLIWLDGEALCVTPSFAAELAGQVPSWLASPAVYSTHSGVWRTQVPLANNRVGQLVRRSGRRVLAWLSGVLRGQRPTSPELGQAALLFHLQRHGVAGPCLLAVGQKQEAGHQGSFLLTETPVNTVPLVEWLAKSLARSRRDALQQCARMLRCLHEAGCELSDVATLAIQEQGEQLTVLLGTVEGVQRCRQPGMRNLRHLYKQSSDLCGKTEWLRILLEYLGLRRLTPATRHWARTLLGVRRVAR